jgi:CO/xanthine dehydrogenase Mo-binding subunit
MSHSQNNRFEADAAPLLTSRRQSNIIAYAVDPGCVSRVETAIDCGFCVNPERTRSQIEGAAVMGLTLAKYGEITLKNGAVEQSNLERLPALAHQ